MLRIESKKYFIGALFLFIFSVFLFISALFIKNDTNIALDETQKASITKIIKKPKQKPKPTPKIELLGSATTTFWGSSANRKHNIKIGAKYVSDIEVAPGEIYSFLEHLGNVGPKEGYKKELVISAGSTKKEYGGGICQVSTTLFRAVLDAGLPVVERHGHGYVVGYYGPGLDATIYGPWTDFKFLNDTEYPIIVKSTTTNNSINFSIYGVNDGRVSTTTPVKITNVKRPPKPIYTPDFSLDLGKKWCTETAVRGMDTTVTYSIKYKDGQEKVQVFNTKYKPWGKRCYLGVKVTPKR